jgi:transposase
VGEDRAVYGPHKTIYNRFARWSERGIWQRIFEAVAAQPEPPKQTALDSSHVKVHRCASGGKGGRISGDGFTKGGRNSKIHAILDAFLRRGC